TVSPTCDLYASQHLARLVSSHAGAAYAVGEHITDHGSDLCTSRSADQVVADQRLRKGLRYGVARQGRKPWRLPFDADNYFGAGEFWRPRRSAGDSAVRWRRPCRPCCREKREGRRVCWTRAVTAALRDAAQAPREGRARGRTLLSAVGDGYSARHLTVLEGLDAVRKRPGMYIGSTDGRGMLHCLWEIIDNSVDEALHGNCTRIELILHANHS